MSDSLCERERERVSATQIYIIPTGFDGISRLPRFQGSKLLNFYVGSAMTIISPIRSHIQSTRSKRTHRRNRGIVRMDTAPFVHAMLLYACAICTSNRNVSGSHMVDHYYCWVPPRNGKSSCRHALSLNWPTCTWMGPEAVDR